MRRDPTPEDYAAAQAIQRMVKLQPCIYCGQPMDYTTPGRYPTRDHIWPSFSRSMTEGRVGKVWCCQACNTAKGSMMPADWLRVLEARRQA